MKEEVILKRITKEFSEAIKTFNKRNYKGASELFDKIIEKYRDSEYYSVLEIQSKAKVYQNIANSQLNPVKIKLASDDEYLYQGIYDLNAGNLDKSLESFNHLKKNNYKDSYLDYLLAVVYLEKDDKENALIHLKKCVDKDDFYKILAYNEPAFETIIEDEDFLTLVE